MENVHELWQKTVQSAVRQYARSRTPEDKEDLESECFLEILEKRALWEPIFEVQGQNAARNYIHKLCRNRVLDVIRGDAHEVEIVDVDIATVQIMDKGSGPDTEVIEDAIKRLNRDEQYIVRRTFYQGETEREIAASLGCGRTHVRSVRAKALSQIKTYLEAK